MTKDPFLCFLKSATEVSDKLEKARADYDEQKRKETFFWKCVFWDGSIERTYPSQSIIFMRSRMTHLTSRLTKLIEMCSQMLISLISEEVEPLCVGGRRVVDAIVVSAVTLLSFVDLYLIGYIDRGGSKAGSSGSLDFRDIYISIDLFQAAYVWIKFRDVISRGAVYYRPRSKKFEPRIKFPIMKGVGSTSKRIPLGLYDTFGEGEVVYQIAAFYCKKRKHTGRLDLGGGASFPIPILSMDPNLPYEEKVKQVGDQVLKVYAEFEEQKVSRNLPPSILGRESSPIQQLHNLGMDSVMQGQIECLKSQVSQTEFKNMEWEVKFSDLDMKYSELESKYSELEQKSSELEREYQLFEPSD